MSNTQIELLTDDILTRFKDTVLGHCARINFLSTIEAEAICQQIASRNHDTLLATHILTKQYTAKKQAPIYITVDKAIELRNRKQEKLCLFVPTDLVDAAYSSLGNSFAAIDGRLLHTRALKRVLSQLPTKAAQFVRAAFAQLHGSLNASDDQKLAFALAVLQHTEHAELANAGLELWRVGLIADATIAGLLDDGSFSDLETRLGQNRHCTIALSRPLKIDATTRERIQSLKVDDKTALLLTAFFRGQSLNNIQSWSQQLASREDLTFNCWTFPTTETSDIRRIIITPFVNAAGRVEKYSHLDQPDGDKGSLIARCGPKEKLLVKWKCEPEQPKNLNGWRVAIVPADSDIEYEGTIELPERDLPAQRRTITINMNIEFDAPPDFSVRVRVMPINKDGSVIINNDNEEEMLCGESNEFFLSKKSDEPLVTSTRESKFVVSTLPYGRLDYAVETKDALLTETEPQWSSKDLEYFSLKLNDRRMLQIGLSATLLTIERQSIANPRQNNYYLLDVDAVHAVDSQEIVSYSLSGDDQDGWKSFWKARDLFFSRLRKEPSRDVIEVVEWTPDLTNAALRYAQSYRELLDDLVARQVDPQLVRELLSIDSLLVRIAGRNNSVEEAMLILPIHPLRVAWFVNYTQLLLAWETQLLTLSAHDRKSNLDLQALRLLTPINVPPFSYHASTSTTFTFFQNLRFFHGVALPAEVPDPHRRYGDIAILFGMTSEQGSIDDNHPEQLAEYLKNFLELHPYTKTLVATLVNPDRGNFFAEALKQLMPARKFPDEEAEQSKTPTFQIIAYTDSRHKSTLQAIGQLRQVQIDQQYQQITDQFLPGIATISRPIQQLNAGKLPEAHIAMVTDLTHPAITALTVDEQNTNGPTSFSLYGLVNRFNSQFSAEQGFLRWQHRIITEGVRKPEAHPAGPKYGELLIELHTKLLKAGGYLLSGRSDTHPVLEVILSEEQRILLERLHESTNWVVTLDRFFTLDYYDSPNEPALNTLARKYVLDYSPEFTDGLGHRMMVTTAWHEEIQSLLSQAMHDLGFSRINQSVSRLLHHLKTISGRLALQALESPTTASAAVGLGVVTAWLESKGRLKQGVLIPVDIYPRLFSLNSSGKTTAGERRCDLVLVSLKRNIVDATFIEVKWRRGHIPYEELSKSMVLQMKSSAAIMHNRFFNERRIDGALQRSYLANVLRFYFERSRRYNLFDPDAEASFLDYVARLEKNGLDFRPAYEGYIVSLDGEERRPFPVDEARITVLTAKDFEQSTEFTSQISPTLEAILDSSEVVSPYEDDADEHEEILSPEVSQPSQQSQSAQETVTPIVNTPSENVEIRQTPETQNAPLPLIDETQHDQHVETELQPITIPLGEASGSRLSIDWLPAIHGSPHLFILGIPGQGKSWTVTRILTELAQQQVPALVLDFHGQFADPHEPFVQASHPTVLDAAKGLPFSPFECNLDSGSNGWQANAFAVSEIFAHVVNLGDIQRDIVFSAILEAYKDHGFQDELALSATNLTYPTLHEVLQRIEVLAQLRHSSSVVARCRPLLEMNLFRPQEQMSDLLSLIRSGLVIDLHNLYIETLQLAAGAFVLRKIYKDMFSWGSAKRLRLAIVLDEAHRLAKDVTLPKLMREGRKFGIAVIVASQGMADFHPDVLGTAGTKVIFRMNFPDSKKVAGFIHGLPGQDLASRIQQLTVGSAYVQTPDMNIASVVKMFPLK